MSPTPRSAGHGVSIAPWLLVVLAAACSAGPPSAGPPAAPPVARVEAETPGPSAGGPAEEARLPGICDGPSIEGTPEAEEAMRLCELYRQGLEDKDWSGLVALASPEYHDDGGTPDPADDVRLGDLEAALDALYGRVGDVRFEVRIERVSAGADVVCVAFAYAATLTVEGRATRLADESVLVFERSDNGLRILSGM